MANIGPKEVKAKFSIAPSKLDIFYGLLLTLVCFVSLSL
jgi:hypothetical protein